MIKSIMGIVAVVLVTNSSVAAPKPQSSKHLVWVPRSQSGPHHLLLGPIATAVPHSMPAPARPDPGHYEWVNGESGPRANSWGKHRIWVTGPR